MDFKKINANMDPTLVVHFMNTTINHYDKIVQGYSRIFKVETKADGSYMCVSGIEQDEDYEAMSIKSTTSSKTVC